MTFGTELDFDGSVNARDLAGSGRVQPGAVVRMEQPTCLTESGWKAVWDYGVRTVLDLCNPDEYQADRYRRPSTITTIRVPLDPIGTPFYERWLKIDHLASPLYYPAMLAEHPEHIIDALRAIANAAQGCVIFHCSAGKDRTGLLALVLLTLAEASPQHIIDDYLLSYDRMKRRYDELGIRDQLTSVTDLLAAHDTTIEESLTATITSMAMPNFLIDNGLSHAELAALRNRVIA